VFLNPARQASSHDVLSAGRVTGMVRRSDVSWATGNANPYTYSIEVDPKIMYKFGYTRGRTAALVREADQIFETLAERIADLGLHNTPWKAHNQFPVPYTECNPIPWNQVMARAKYYYNKKNSKQTEKPKPKKAKITWKKYPKAKQMVLTRDAYLWEFDKTSWGQFGKKGYKKYEKGHRVSIYGQGYNQSLKATYLVTKYSYERKIARGFNQADLEAYVAPVKKVPEWSKNLKDISMKVKIIVDDAKVINLETGKKVTTLPKGTVVDVGASTVLSGKDYLISVYSAERSLPTGFAGADAEVYVPEKKQPEKPEWLKNFDDIEDVDMIARGETEVTDMGTGMIAKIPKGTVVHVEATTTVLDEPFYVTEGDALIRKVDLTLAQDIDKKKYSGSVWSLLLKLIDVIMKALKRKG